MDVLTICIYTVMSLARFVLSNNALEFNIKYENLQTNMLFVLDVQTTYDMKTIFIVDADNDESLRVTTILTSLLRQLSERNVYSMTMSFTQLAHYEQYYRHRIRQPTYVVFVHDMKQVERFQRATSNNDLVLYPRWLLIYSRNVSDICKQPKINYFHVEFDTRMIVKCHDDPVIKEWYSVDGKNMKSTDLALWDYTKGFRKISKVGMYNRRHNLDGHVLKIATVKDSPFVTANTGQDFFATILNELSGVLNFSTILAYEEDLYGSWDNKTGKHHGVIGRLEAKEIDIGVAEFTMTKRRLNVVDFTTPIMVSKNYLFVKKADKAILMLFSYFKVYSFLAWLGFQGMLCLSIGIVIFIELVLKIKPLTSNYVSETSLSIWGIFCQQGLPEFPKATSKRVAYVSILMTSVILLSVYSACLISYVTLSPSLVLFNDFAEFTRDGSYQLITLFNSSDYDLFMHTNHVLYKDMSRLMPKPEYLPKNVMAGFTQVCTMKKIAFYTTEAVTSSITGRIPCDVTSIASGTVGSMSMTMTKANQYKDLLDFYLKRLRDNGLLAKLRADVYDKATKAKKYPFVPVPIIGVASVLMCLGVGILLSLVILFIEIVIYRWNNSRRNNKRVVSVKRIITM